jgi:hypothetical protein
VTCTERVQGELIQIVDLSNQCPKASYTEMIGMIDNPRAGLASEMNPLPDAFTPSVYAT